jgi:membrane protease subunit HflC
VVSLEREKVMSEILANVEKRAQPLGVQIVDVRLRRIEFAPEISESVYRRMEAERKRVANELRSIGAAEGEKIRAEADRKREEIMATAYAKAQAIMGEGDAQASSIYAEAYGKDPVFYTFYKSLEAYRASFSKLGDLLVVDPTSEFFQFFKSSMGTPGAPSGTLGGLPGSPTAPVPAPAK